MTLTDLKTPDTPSEASLSQIYPPIDPWTSLLIPLNLHWSPINLLWSGICPSAVHQMTVHDSPMASEGFPVTNDSLPFAFLASYSTADSLPYQACWLICLLIPLPSNESFSLCLLIHAYPLLTHQLQAPIVLLQIPYKAPLLFQILLTPPYVYKAPWSSEEPRWNPPLNSMNLSLSQDVSLSLSLFFKSCRLQCKSKGFIIQVYSSLSSPSHFSRLKRSLGSLFSVSHHFWTSGAPLSTCCTNLQV